MIYDKYKFKVPEEKMVRVITNSDVKNEADDPFAVVHALLSPKFDNVGMIAAHFGIDRDSKSMEHSYQELVKIADIMELKKEGLLFRGAERPLQDAKTPIDSEGARLIIKEAMSEDPRPLYVIFFGPLTDMASAYLIEPRIANRVTVIWIGGGMYPNGGPEFNLGNDIHAANVVFGSNMNVWQVPKNVYEMMPVSLAELEYRLLDNGKLGNYLFDQLVEHSYEEIPRKSPFRTGESWVLGDNPAVGLILYEHRFEFDWVRAPYITVEMQYVHTGINRPIRVYKKIDSRLLLEDLFCKISLYDKYNNKKG